MKALFLTYGSRGDVQPYCALALALKARGHEARVAAPENYRGLVEGLGLDYAPLPGDTISVLDDPGVKQAMLANQTLRFFRRVRDRMGEELPGRLGQACLQAAEGRDLVVAATVTELLAQSVTEKLKLPLALTELVPLSPTSSRPHFAIPFNLGPLNRLTHWLGYEAWWRLHLKDLNALRGRWDLGPLRSNPLAKGRAEGIVLHGYSQALCPRPADWGANHIQCGPWSLPAEGREGIGEGAVEPGFQHWLEEGVAPFYLSFGSLPVLPPHELAELAAEVSEALNLRAVVMAAGIEKAYAEDCAIPDGLALVERANHAQLFPHCSALVHHAGSGTTHAASLSGVPQVLCPVFADQFFWARQVARQGAGLILPAARLDAASLSLALERASGEAFQGRAADLAGRLAAEGGAPAAAEALEKAFALRA